MKKKAGWTDRHSYVESIEFLKTIAQTHAVKAGRFSAALQDLLEGNRWADLLEFAIDYRDDDDPATLYHARQVLAFFEKFEPLKLAGVDKEAVAFRRFCKSEVLCRLVNERFCNYRLGYPMGYPYDDILVNARKKIRQVLGPAPKLEDLDFSFGPGATTGVKKADACARVKLGAAPECSNELFPFADRLLSALPVYTLHHCEASTHPLGIQWEVIDYDWAVIPDRLAVEKQLIERAHLRTGDSFAITDVNVKVTPGKLQFVPKDAKKFRTIVVEPTLNTLLQQALGKQIRKRLKKYAGIDLTDQGKNRTLACHGSLNNELATVDFSAASDTIATQLVAFLLPDDWFTWLSLARTRTVEYEGLYVSMEKFSSMGNSFTFELESLIFWALGYAVCSRLSLPVDGEHLSIFGDDLIISSDAYPLAELVFAFCGFTVNPDKSFVRGPFRESCGEDYFKGVNIRPYFQKDLVSPETIFTLHNYYVRSGLLSEANNVLQFLHPDLIIFGPDGYGDGHLIGDWTPVPRRVSPTHVARKGSAGQKPASPKELGWEGAFIATFVHVTCENHVPHHGDALLPTFSIYLRGDGDEVQDDPPTHGSQKQLRWADSRYFAVPGSKGYRKAFIYVRRYWGIFQ